MLGPISDIDEDITENEYSTEISAALASLTREENPYLWDQLQSTRRPVLKIDEGKKVTFYM